MSSIQNTIMCEGWVEKQVVSSDVNKNKWKTRYAVLLRPNSNTTELELSFYSKKFKTGSQTEDFLMLKPWKCIANMEETSRQYSLKLQLFMGGFYSPSTMATYIAMQCREEVKAWLRCIQGITKLNIGTHECLHYVVSEQNIYSDNISASNKQCILLLGNDCVTLALKNGNIVVAVWPLSYIRSYSSSSPNHFSITSGRRSPLGEGLYCFQTKENAGETLFADMDRLTGVPYKKQTQPRLSSKSRASSQHKSQPRNAPELPSPNLPPPNAFTPLKPPRKPPLPKNIKLPNFQTHLPENKQKTNFAKIENSKLKKCENNAKLSPQKNEKNNVSTKINPFKSENHEQNINDGVRNVLNDILNKIETDFDENNFHGVYSNDIGPQVNNLTQRICLNDLNKQENDNFIDSETNCVVHPYIVSPKPKIRTKRYSTKTHMEEYTEVNKL